MKAFLVFLGALVADLRQQGRAKINDTQLSELMAHITPECEKFLADCDCDSLRSWVDLLVAGDAATWITLNGQICRLDAKGLIPRIYPEVTEGVFGPFAPRATERPAPPLPGREEYGLFD